jgi:hypothetical protein
MKHRSLLTITLSMLLVLSSLAQPENGTIKRRSDYLGYNKPGNIPEVFAPDFISTQFAEFAGTFSPGLDEYYFTRRGPFAGGIAQIMVSRKTDTAWTTPQLADFSSGYYEFEPFITPDGGRLYYGSRRSPDGIQPPGQMHQWFLTKENDTWSEPVLLGEPFFSRMVMYPCITLSQRFYFTGMDGIYYSDLEEGSYQEPVRLGPEINFMPMTAHAFVAPDESYMLFDAQPQEEGKSSIFISYMQENGSWTKGKSIGKEINAGESQAIASVSPDGECLFFTRDQDIFWVDAAVIDKMRLIPEMSYHPHSGMAPLNIQFNLDLQTVPDSIIAFEWDFNMDGEVDSHEQNPQYSFTAGGTYTVWLKVYSNSCSATKIYDDIIIIKEDTAGFGILKWPENNNQGQLFQNYPNPCEKNTVISFLLPDESSVILGVYDILGNNIETIVEAHHKPGFYNYYFRAQELLSGPYIYTLTTENHRFSRVMLKK